MSRGFCYMFCANNLKKKDIFPSFGNKMAKLTTDNPDSTTSLTTFLSFSTVRSTDVLTYVLNAAVLRPVLAVTS